MIGLTIIADDLTGALDAAAPFAEIEGGVAVATRPEAIPEVLEAPPSVLAVSTRSRDLAPGEARKTVETVLAALPKDTRLFKKIDSRLKGQVAAELAAFGDHQLLVAPAIPEFGRVIRDGALQGFGVSAPIPVRDALGLGNNALIPDVATVEDLDAAIAASSDDMLLVGARGLAAALARAMGIPIVPQDRPLPRPICIAAGSLDPITLAQIAALRTALPEVHYVHASTGMEPEASSVALPPVTVIQTTDVVQTSPEDVAREFARTARARLAEAKTMILTGGATAEACLDALEINVLKVVGEALPGMPLCEAGDKKIITKSGGFGAPDALLRLAGATETTEA